jgi:hypothetical protein
VIAPGGIGDVGAHLYHFTTGTWNEMASSCPRPGPGTEPLANADHLAILNAICTDLTTAAREQHYWNLLPQRHEFEREAAPVAGRYRRVRSAWPARRRAAGSTSASPQPLGRRL